MVIQHLSLHTPRNVIHDGSLAYKSRWPGRVGVEQETAGVETVEPSSYI